jgi:hypothetical protein
MVSRHFGGITAPGYLLLRERKTTKALAKSNKTTTATPEAKRQYRSGVVVSGLTVSMTPLAVGVTVCDDARSEAATVKVGLRAMAVDSAVMLNSADIDRRIIATGVAPPPR